MARLTSRSYPKSASYDPPWETLIERKKVPKATKIQCHGKILNRPAQYMTEFHGAISREEAEDLVFSYPDGGYLVRESQRQPGSYNLTLRCHDASKHYKLYYSGGMHFIGENRFATLDDLVNDGLKTMYLETFAEDFNVKGKKDERTKETAAAVDKDQFSRKDGGVKDEQEGNGRRERNKVPKVSMIACQKEIANKPAQYAKEFHGVMSREDANVLLVQSIDDSYLVRERPNAPGKYALSLRLCGIVHHHELSYDGMYFIGESKRCESLEDLVTYVTEYHLNNRAKKDEKEIEKDSHNIVRQQDKEQAVEKGSVTTNKKQPSFSITIPDVEDIKRNDFNVEGAEQHNETQDNAEDWVSLEEKRRGNKVPKATKIACQKEIPQKPAQYAEEFHGVMSRRDAKDLVSMYGDGYYLVRERQKSPGNYALALRLGGVCKRFKLNYDGMHNVGENRFKTLDDLVTDILTNTQRYVEDSIKEKKDGENDVTKETSDATEKKPNDICGSYLSEEDPKRSDASTEDKPQRNGNAKAPLEILARGPFALQAYQRALAEGKTIVKRVPIMFIGQNQSGKTSLKKSLKGEMFDPDEKSTRGIEMDPSYCEVTTEVWKMGEKTTAENSDLMPISYEQRTAQYILSNLNKEIQERQSRQLKGDNVTGDERSPSLPADENDSDHGDAPRLRTFEVSHNTDVMLENVPEVPVVPDVPNVPEVSHVPEVSEVPEKIAALVERLFQVDDNGKDKEDIYSMLWDFGGQSVYYVTHPLFLTTRAIYFLVYNLSWDPKETADPRVKQGLYKDVIDVFCDRSNLDYLDVWMSSVSSLVSHNEETIVSDTLPEKLPPVFLVCTHADKPCQDKCPSELAREIYGSLKAKIHGKHLVDVFFVDNTKSGSGQECQEVTRLRREVLRVAKKLPQMKEIFPIKWLKYEKALQNTLEDGFKKWISIDDARKIAEEECRISNDEQFQTLLNFLHDQRILIHFDDTPELNRMVILDPQWLVDVFSKVIAPKPSEKKGRKFEELWLKLEETGILEERLLQHVWSPFFDSEETSHSLVALMEKFCLLCPWPLSSESKSLKEYLVPSMLMFPPKEDVTKLIASAGIPSLFVRFESGEVPCGLFPRLVLMVYQWCTKEWLCQSKPNLHHNFARFFTHHAEGFSIILLCHSSSIEVLVHKKDSAGEISKPTSPGLKLSLESSYDAFQVNVAHAVCRQLGLMLECMRKEFHWLKNMKYIMSVCCPVCCKQGAANHCRRHNVRGCKQEECLHFWSESQLRECREPIICTESAVAEDYRVPMRLFRYWFKFLDEQGAIVKGDGKALPCEEGESAQALVLPSGVLEALQLQTCDANGVVARLQESLSLEQASLKHPDPKTKQQIRHLCMKANTANRLDVVKKLREITPAGTTGPLSPEALDVENIPFAQRKELTMNLCGGDEWKPFAEKLGLSPAEIRFLDKRLLDPCDAALSHSRNLGNINSVGDLYDALVDCELPVMADLL